MSGATRTRGRRRATTRELRRSGTGDDLIPVRGDVGGARGSRAPASLPWGQPSDQRTDDAWSRCYDWPVTEAFEILGHCELRGASRRRRRWRSSRRSSATSSPTARRRSSRGHAQPHAPAVVGATRGAGARCRGRRGRRAGGDVVGVRARAPHPARARRHRLAERMATARAGHVARRSVVGAVLAPRAARRRRRATDPAPSFGGAGSGSWHPESSERAATGDGVALRPRRVGSPHRGERAPRLALRRRARRACRSSTKAR